MMTVIKLDAETRAILTRLAEAIERLAAAPTKPWTCPNCGGATYHSVNCAWAAGDLPRHG